MANSEHIEIVKKGSDAITRFRRDNRVVILDLTDAKLSHANLTRADLSGADLIRADLSSADLSDANLSDAKLSHSNMTRAKLSHANLTRADLFSADLAGADLLNAKLSHANLACAKLSDANLSRADLSHAYLFDANLSSADMSDADLTRANLNGADLSGVDLQFTSFNSTDVSNTVFNFATLGYGVFANTDLSTVIGFDSVVHEGPTSIGIDSIWRSKGKIPEAFLRGCGVPEDLITFFPSLIGDRPPIQFYSCFISYSHQDEEFCKRLYARMQQEQLRVWYAPEDMKAGEKIHDQIDGAIKLHDKLLLVLSERSMNSDWVATEIYRARKREKADGKRVLFPIRLCSFDGINDWSLFTDQAKDLAVEIREYFIPDFSNWKDHDAFEAGFSKLLRDLRAAGE